MFSFSIYKKFFLEFGSSQIKVQRDGKGYICINNVVSKTTEGYLFDEEALKNYTKDLIYPVRDGKIYDFESSTKILKSVFSKLGMKSLSVIFFKKKVYVPIHSTYSEVELSALTDALKISGMNKIVFINEGVAAFCSFSKPIEDMEAYLICNIGAEVTDLMIIKSGEILNDQTTNFGSNNLNLEVKKLLKDKYGLDISFRNIEKIKKRINLNPKRSNKKQEVEVVGRDRISFKTKSISVSHAELVKVSKNAIEENILKTINSLLEKAEVESLEDLNSNGMLLTGGGSKLLGLKEYLGKKLKFDIQVSKLPELSVIKGLKKVSSDNVLEKRVEIKESLLL